MAKPLRVLIAEDSENDALLMVKELERGGFAPVFERVETAQAMTAALGRANWDVVLADYLMPGFTALDALSVLRMSGLDLPFLVVSGSIGEEIAVEAMRAGAHDYIMKDNLTRLSAAVERELRQAEGRRLKYKAETALKETNQTLWSLIKSSPLAIVTVDLQRNVTMWNPAAERLFGWSDREVLGTTLPIVPKDKHPEFREMFERAVRGQSTANLETKRRRKDGSLVDVAMTVAALLDAEGKPAGAMAVFADISERKKAEQIASEVENRNRAILKSATDGIITIDHQGRIVEFNPAAEKIFGHRREAVLGKELAELVIPHHLRERHREGLRNYLSTRHSRILGERLEMTALRADGREFPVEISIQRIAMGEPPLFTGFIRDISERKKAEEELRRSEARLRAFVSAIPDLVFILDEDGRYVEALTAPTKERLLYEEIQKLKGKLLHEVLPKEAADLYLSIVRKTIESQQPQILEYSLDVPAGKCWFEGRTAPIPGAEGPRLVVWVSREITERKKSEEALKNSETLLAKTQQMVRLGGWQLDLSNLEDLNKNELRWTEESFRIFGYEPGSVKVTNDLFFQIVHPEDRPKIVEAVARALAEKTAYSIEHRIVRPDGVERVVHEHADIVFDEESGRPLRMVGAVQDVTERKRLEEAQAEREKLALLAAEVGAALTQSTSLKEMLDRCSEILVRNLDAAFARIWTLNENEQMLELQASAGMYTHLDGPHGRVPVGKFKIGLIAQERKPHLTNSVIGDPRVGDQEWAKREGMVAFAGYPLIIEERLLGVMAMFARHTLTDFALKALSAVANQIALGIERKRGEAALRESEERFRQFAENSKDVIWITNTGLTETLYVNPAYEKVFERSRERLFSEPRAWMEAIHPEDREKMLVPGVSAEVPDSPFSQEFRIVRNDGSLRWIRARVFPIKNDAGKTYRQAGIAEDITEQKQLAEQFRQAQKMEAVGQLAGGIAHDFNNLLTAIGGYTDFVSEQVEPNSRLKQDVEEIKKATERAAALTRQLLAFSRRQVMQPVLLNLNELVCGMEGMLSRLIGENLELVTVPAPQLALVNADPNQLEQVIMNLCVNARDAMLQGGRLTIETGNVELDEAFVQQHVGAQPGAYVMLAVSDTGTGMSPEVQKHLFEPFFTTKEKGKGTGLGLSTVYGIVKQSGGYISVYSEPGRGSCFKIYLPQVVQPAPEKPAKPAAPAPLKNTGGTETILLVEDEGAVRALAGKILRANGYTVLEAGDGAEAQEVVKEHKGALDLLLTDVVMPRMGGPELAARLKRARRGVKILFMTGYTDHSAFREGSLPDGTGLIQKPFSPQGLAQKVREILDSTKNSAPSFDETEKLKKPAAKK
ncbi:MAG TPA: PAS domain S-box protein [Verrucomicrobiae bacterium]|nr:PAS domain S-box protein [Verrucomicrobiae bacterium]